MPITYTPPIGDKLTYTTDDGNELAYATRVAGSADVWTLFIEAAGGYTDFRATARESRKLVSYIGGALEAARTPKPRKVFKLTVDCRTSDWSWPGPQGKANFYRYHWNGRKWQVAHADGTIAWHSSGGEPSSAINEFVEII